MLLFAAVSARIRWKVAVLDVWGFHPIPWWFAHCLLLSFLLWDTGCRLSHATTVMQKHWSVLWSFVCHRGGCATTASKHNQPLRKREWSLSARHSPSACYGEAQAQRRRQRHGGCPTQRQEPPRRAGEFCALTQVEASMHSMLFYAVLM